MKKYSDLEYLRLSKWDKFLYKLVSFFVSIPVGIWNALCTIGYFFRDVAVGIGGFFKDLVMTFVNGSWKTKISYVIMGFGNITRGQILRGLMFLVFEIVFFLYMFIPDIPNVFVTTNGSEWLAKLSTLGTVGPHEVYDPILDTYTTVYGDNSFKILLYGVLTLFFIVAFLYTWYANVKQNKICEQILASGKKLRSGKDDLRSLIDDKFHTTLLALPMTGIMVFTVMPIVFMILVAFTNYDGAHNGYTNSLFTWVGLDNFNTLLNMGSYTTTFAEVLSWTLMWAFLATFTNYFLGMGVAMAINKKGIRFKKGFRTILVMTIAIPQFISLMYVSKMFARNGLVNEMLKAAQWISTALPFWEDVTWARVMVVIINIWIGIPYLMLVATGILMNIPQDLYESAKIDGANAWQQFSKITLPYMLFITGPYLLTQFTGNMNNFNVIYLLSGGGPTNIEASTGTAGVGYTDLLVTWLFKLTTGAESSYYMASVIGILIFVVVAVISLIVYGLLPSVKNEEDFQ